MPLNPCQDSRSRVPKGSLATRRGRALDRDLAGLQDEAPGGMATSCSSRTSADPYGGMSAGSAAGVECAPAPTWPEGPKIGSRRPAHHGPPSNGDLVTDGSCAVLRSARSTRGAYQDRRPAPARRAPRALEDVEKVLTAGGSETAEEAKRPARASAALRYGARRTLQWGSRPPSARPEREATDAAPNSG